MKGGKLVFEFEGVRRHTHSCNRKQGFEDFKKDRRGDRQRNRYIGGGVANREEIGIVNLRKQNIKRKMVKWENRIELESEMSIHLLINIIN